MKYEDFKKKLKENNLDMTLFAKDMGTTYSTVSKWKPETPAWVDKYFEIYEENKKAKELKLLLKDFCEKL